MRINLKKKNVRNIALLGFFPALWLMSMPFFNRWQKKDFQIFYSSTLKGKIVHQGAAKRDILKLDNSEVEYRFTSNMSWFNHYQTFSQTAKKGDSVYKAALSDTIYLVKANGSRYKFTFDKLK